MKVFISSTVYDLMDVRAELYSMFKEMGMEPIMSEAIDSTFEVLTDRNSIETCFINLDKSDFVVLVLSQRYGASLAKSGYGDFSATHLEYLRAIENRKPIYIYVRDRLAADYAIFKKTRNKSQVSYAWVGNEDLKLFELLDHHTKLIKESSNTNWYKIFRDSVELKVIVKNDFRFKAAKTTIQKLLSDNRFPLLVPDLDVDTNAIHTHSKLIYKVRIKNAGGAPAFNYIPKWVNEDVGYFEEQATKQEIAIIAPGDETIMTAIYQLGRGHVGKSMDLSLSYSNADGYRIVEVYEIKARVIADPNISVLSGCTLKTRRFELGKPFEITIEEEMG